MSIVMDRNRSVTANFALPDGEGPPRFHLPWAAGVTRTVGQANDGPFTHQGRFAWDVALPVGTPVTAVASGRVIRAEDQHPDNPGGFPDDPQTPSNAVWIDHGGGLQAVYAHLTPGGAKVVAGQLVAAGQCIGLSGNSGYSSGPHLHYEVLDAALRSAPSAFVEVTNNGGVAEEGDVLTSQNELDVASAVGFAESVLPINAFESNGVELIEPTPPAFFYATGVEYTIAGTVLTDDDFVCVSLVDPDSGQTVYCRESLVQVAGDGSFEIGFRFPETLVGHFALGVISGKGGVSGDAPIRVFITVPPADNVPPVAAVVPPTDNNIDFGESATLDGARSSDPDGDALSYRWTQISGPPASIADATARSTSFTLEVGEGTVEVVFQLVVFDGQDYSLPAQVEYVMADSVAAGEVGLSQTECANVVDCQTLDTRSVVLGSGRLFFWLELINVSEGDVSSAEIRDAAGVTVLRDELTHEAPAASVFARFGWTFDGQLGMPGAWSAVYLHNGVVEATVDFNAF